MGLGHWLGTLAWASELCVVSILIVTQKFWGFLDAAREQCAGVFCSQPPTSTWGRHPQLPVPGNLALFRVFWGKNFQAFHLWDCITQSTFMDRSLSSTENREELWDKKLYKKSQQLQVPLGTSIICMSVIQISLIPRTPYSKYKHKHILLSNIILNYLPFWLSNSSPTPSSF